MTTDRQVGIAATELSRMRRDIAKLKKATAMAEQGQVVQLLDLLAPSGASTFQSEGRTKRR